MQKNEQVEALREFGAFSEFETEGIKSRMERKGYYLVSELVEKGFEQDRCLTGSTMKRFSNAVGIPLTRLCQYYWKYLTVIWMPVGYYDVEKLTLFFSERSTEPPVLKKAGRRKAEPSINQ